MILKTGMIHMTDKRWLGGDITRMRGGGMNTRWWLVKQGLIFYSLCHLPLVFQQPFLGCRALSTTVVPNAPRTTFDHSVTRDQEGNWMLAHGLAHCSCCRWIPCQVGQLPVCHSFTNLCTAQSWPYIVGKGTWELSELRKLAVTGMVGVVPSLGITRGGLGTGDSSREPLK